MLKPMCNPGSGQPLAAEGEGEWAARNPSRLGKGEGARQCNHSGWEGSGKQHATLAAEGEAPLPLALNQAPTSACASAPATSTCAWGMGVAHV